MSSGNGCVTLTGAGASRHLQEHGWLEENQGGSPQMLRAASGAWVTH